MQQLMNLTIKLITKMKYTRRLQINFLLSLFLFVTIGTSLTNAQPANIQAIPKIKVEPMKWIAEDHIVEGWDWSLPPGAKPHPYSGILKPWPTIDGKRYDFPGFELKKVRAQWRELEPEEGKFQFDILKKRIEETIAEGWDGIELHIYGAVWEIADFPNHPVAKYPPNWLQESKIKNESAPRWLEKYNISKIKETPRLDISTPFQIYNLNIYDPAYHSRYLRFIKALGETGLFKNPAILCVYQHTKSGSRGEEGMRPDEPEYQQRLRERLETWAAAFGKDAYKLMYTDGVGEEVLYAYKLGMGQRNGFVEQVVNHIPNPLLGQLVDKEHYLVTDESVAPIAEGRAFGDENEEYEPLSIPRFGPWESFMHRLRESTLRTLQLRRNFVWVEPNMLDPDLTCYESLSLGHNVQTTTDAWCYLRESYPDYEGKPLQVKNFERWLYQRDKPGFVAKATAKVNVSEKMIDYAKGYHFDYTARKTERDSGNTAIGFALDDRFLGGGTHKVAIKVTYHDQGQAKWALVYNQGKSSKVMTTWSYGNLRTATWILNDISFDAKGMDYDFEIRALEGDAIIKFVRVIKLDVN